MPIPFPPRRLALALAMLTLAAHSQAQTAADAAPAGNTLGAISVVGDWLDNPNEEKVLEHGGARTIIERSSFQDTGATNVRDVLRRVPGVQVQESNGTGGSDVSLNVGVRGLTSRLSPRSTILMDGIPLAVAPYGQPQLSMAPVSLGNLSAVDVVRGAGSVRYGPQNVGGIINFVTRAIPRDFTADATVETDMYSHGGVKTSPSAFIGGTNERGLGGALLYSGTHGNGFRESNDRVDIDDVMLKGTYRIGADDSVSAALHHYEGRAGMPGGLTTRQYSEDPFQSTRPYDSFTGRRTDASFRYNHDDGINKFELLTYYTDSFRGSSIETEGTGANAGKRRLTFNPRNYHTFAIEPRYSRLFRGADVTQEISVGYRYLKEASDERASRTAFYVPDGGFDPLDAPNPQYQYRTGGTTAHAVYIDDTINVGNWTITPGVRYEFIDSFLNDKSNPAARTHTSIKSEEPLPSLSVVYHVSEQWSVFANAGQSFGPLQYFQIASTTNGLHPEKATTYEVGTHFNGGGWKGELTLFNIDFDDELQLRGGTNGGSDAWTNLGATRHRGLETGLSYDLGELSAALSGLSLYGTYTYTQATYKAGVFEGRDLPFYSRNVGSLGARYTRNQWTFNVDTFLQSKQRSPGAPDPGARYQTEESANGAYGDIPGYGTVHVRAAYDFGKQMHNLNIALGVKNLFDKRYFTRSTDNNAGKYVGMPRTVYLQASLAY